MAVAGAYVDTLYSSVTSRVRVDVWLALKRLRAHIGARGHPRHWSRSMGPSIQGVSEGCEQSSIFDEIGCGCGRSTSGKSCGRLYGDHEANKCEEQICEARGHPEPKEHVEQSRRGARRAWSMERSGSGRRARRGLGG